MDQEFAGDPDFMMSLARGLAVLSSFADAGRPMSIGEVSARTGIGRSATRRCLYTLERLGYASHDGRLYSLRPKTLALGNAFLGSDPLVRKGEEVIARLRNRVRESCSMGVIDGDEVRYVARSATVGIMAIALDVGSRLPLYCTSMGRVLLAGLTPATLDAYLARTELIALTRQTVTEPDALRAAIATARLAGHAIVDQELELGLRSVAVPVLGRDGAVVAAINVGTPSARISLSALRDRILPELAAAAAELGAMLDR